MTSLPSITCEERAAQVDPGLTDLTTTIPVCLLNLLDEVESKQPMFRGHGRRTALYAEALGRNVGFHGQSLIQLLQAAFLHDIGKSRLPAHIWQRCGPLSGEDYAVYQSHPRHALAILAPWPFLLVPSIWIAHHHERWDGTGYPFGVRGEHIPLASRILAIADAFDQLVIQHGNDSTGDITFLHRLLQVSANSQFDPHLVEQFWRLRPHVIIRTRAWIPTRTPHV